MNKNIRLTGLDGLRGFAILLVFLTHINAEPILKKLPSFFHPIAETFFSSGVTAVSILFILCGFLMAYLYQEPVSVSSFLQRRYTRIFPLFLSMATAMAIIRLNPGLSPLLRLGIIVGMAVIVHGIWIIIRQIKSVLLSRLLFYSFLAIQIIVGCWYAFYIMRKPAAVFNIMPLHDLSIWLVNSTLTLPLGNYIPMLDGVYWSLSSEVFFYILYPIFCVPIIKSFSHKSVTFKTVFLITLIPFIIGIDQLSHTILDLSMLQFPLFYYFVTGMVLALLYRQKHRVSQQIAHIFYPNIIKSLSVILFLIIIFLVRLNLHTVSPALNPWLRILWAIPLTLMVFMTIDTTTSLSKIFSSKPLVYLGKISYSLYLSHTVIIEIMKDIYTPKGAIDTILFIAVSFAGAVLIASCLQYLLEQPYFTAKNEKSIAQNTIVDYKKTIVLSMITIYLVAILIAYQSDFNFFSSEYKYGKDIVVSPEVTNDSPINMRTYPKVVLEFVAKENDLGILALHPLYSYISNSKKLVEDWQKLRIRIKEKDAKSWYASSEYSPTEIGDSKMLPFGFPVIADSQNKTYNVELELLNPKSNNSIEIRTTPFTASAISQMDKKFLIKNPPLLASHISRRLMNVFLDPNAQKAALLATPTFLLLLITTLLKQSIFH